jgi:hypothetical protein
MDFSFYPLSYFPQGRAERLKIALWAILAKEPACREGSFPVGEGREGGKAEKKYITSKYRHIILCSILYKL